MSTFARNGVFASTVLYFQSASGLYQFKADRIIIEGCTTRNTFVSFSFLTDPLEVCNFVDRLLRPDGLMYTSSFGSLYVVAVVMEREARRARG